MDARRHARRHVYARGVARGRQRHVWADAGDGARGAAGDVAAPPRVPPSRPRPPAGGAEQHAKSTSFLTSIDDLEVPAAPAAPPPLAAGAANAQDVPRGSVQDLLEARRRADMAALEQEVARSERRRRENDEGTRDAFLSQKAALGVHTALQKAQATATEGPLHFGMRPSSAALRQAVSMPALPPVGGSSLRAPPLDEEAQRRRADERARALLRGKYREYQAQYAAGLGAEATVSTEEYLKLRQEARANKPPPREPIPLYELGELQKRRRAEKGERLERTYM